MLSLKFYTFSLTIEMKTRGSIMKKGSMIASKKNLSIYASETNDMKLTEENMFKKLLHPPSKKENKLVMANTQNRKYDPKFSKPDIEDLIKDNICLKKQKHRDKTLINNLNKKNQDMVKKITRLENMREIKIDELVEEKKQTNSNVHTEILKKKIHQLQAKYLTAQAEIKKLKKLPNVSIHEEQNIEKQHLLAQTIRLKSMLASTELGAGDNDNSFLKMLKQDNEKTKSSMRILENEKNSMKASHIIQNKQIADLKKQLETIKQKMVLKEAQIEKLKNENKNLLFKKASQFRFQQQEKQNKEIAKLKELIVELKAKYKKSDEDHRQLQEDYDSLKDKEKNNNNIIQEKQKIIERIRVEKEDIETRVKNLQQSYPKNLIYEPQIKADFEMNNMKTSEEYEGKGSKPFRYGKKVSFYDIELSFLTFWKLYTLGIINKYSEVLQRRRKFSQIQNKQITQKQLYKAVHGQPSKLNKIQSKKFVRYIFDDQLNALNSAEGEESEDQPTLQVTLIVCMIEAGINKLLQCLGNEDITNNWKLQLMKSKKFMKEIQSFSSRFKANYPLISRDQFMSILSDNTKKPIERQEITFISLHCFDIEHSREQIILNKIELLRFLNNLNLDLTLKAEGFKQACSNVDVMQEEERKSADRRVEKEVGEKLYLQLTRMKSCI